MLEPWANTGLNVLYIFGFVIAAIGFFSKIDKYTPTYLKLREENGIFISFFKTVMKLYSKFLVAILVTAVIAVIVYVFGAKHDPIPPEPTPTATPTTEPTVVVYSPITYSLDDLQVLSKEPDDAFFFHQWETNYPIKIDNIEYLRSIGVRLPVEIQDDLKINHITERYDYSAVIEYSLGYKYDMFQFSYGIDDNTFKDFGLPPPNCHYWVVVESCICREDSKVKTKELERTPEVNYMQTLATSNMIDVSKVETLRITFYWKFDVLPTKPLTLNVAIVDPTLYVKAN